jgi:hypothetical protein
MTAQESGTSRGASAQSRGIAAGPWRFGWCFARVSGVGLALRARDAFYALQTRKKR